MLLIGLHFTRAGYILYTHLVLVNFTYSPIVIVIEVGFSSSAILEAMLSSIV
jgi:uncharacterized membrane protein YesL